MDIAAILALTLKGIEVIKTLVDVGQDIAPAVKVVTDMITGAQAGTITDEQLLSTEDALDKMIEDFNEPMTG
jgi:hypothetical protein